MRQIFSRGTLIHVAYIIAFCDSILRGEEKEEEEEDFLSFDLSFFFVFFKNSSFFLSVVCRNRYARNAATCMVKQREGQQG